LSDDRKNIYNKIVIEERQSITLNGVEEVISFDEENIICQGALGMIVVRGSDLHIGRLSLDDGILSAQGNIDSVAYQDEAITGGGFLKRLFR